MTLPDTVTLDIPSRGGPAMGLYQIIGGTPATAPNTCTLDIPSRGGPALALYPKTYPVNLSATVAVSGTLSAIQGRAVFLSATVAVTSTLTKQGQKVFTANPAITGSLAKQGTRSFTTTVAVSGTLAKQGQKVFAVNLPITTTFSGPNGRDQVGSTKVAVLANQGTIIISIQPYKP